MKIGAFKNLSCNSLGCNKTRNENGMKTLNVLFIALVLCCCNETRNKKDIKTTY